jgi:hypothetical protein
MKVLKFKFAALALILGLGAAVISIAPAQASSKFTTYTYGRLADGTWVALNPSLYECDASNQICEGKFTYQNPPQNATPNAGVLINEATYTPIH